MVTCFEFDNDRSKIDDRSLNSPINRFRFGSRFSALVLKDLLITRSLHIWNNAPCTNIVFTMLTHGNIFNSYLLRI